MWILEYLSSALQNKTESKFRNPKSLLQSHLSSKGQKGVSSLSLPHQGPSPPLQTACAPEPLFTSFSTVLAAFLLPALGRTQQLSVSRVNGGHRSRAMTKAQCHGHLLGRL